MPIPTFFWIGASSRAFASRQAAYVFESVKGTFYQLHAWHSNFEVDYQEDQAYLACYFIARSETKYLKTMSSSEISNGKKIPDDFPRDPFPASISGFQPKVGLRLIDGEYVAGLTHQERMDRYVCCLDMVEQLTNYTLRKRQERPDLTLLQLLDQIDKGIRFKSWELAEVELAWIMVKVRESFSELREPK